MSMFSFKQFSVCQDRSAMKVGTDGVLLGAWASGGNSILDVGTGTGLIALMMSQRFPQAQVTAIDIDDQAVAEALQNVESSPFSQRITVCCSSLQQFAVMHNHSSFDSIVCNPPFFEETLHCPDAARNVARHTEALPFSDLTDCCAALLSERGTLNLIIPVSALGRVEEQCAYSSLFLSEKLFVRTVQRKQPKRVMLRMVKHPVPCVINEQVLMEDGCRSQWYAQITNDFYL